MQTIGERGGISGQVREARGRVRELAQTERAREQQQRERRSKRATSEQQPEREEKQREDFPAKITSYPDLSSRQTPNKQGQYRMERSCRSIS